MYQAGSEPGFFTTINQHLIVDANVEKRVSSSTAVDVILPYEGGTHNTSFFFGALCIMII